MEQHRGIRVCKALGRVVRAEDSVCGRKWISSDSWETEEPGRKTSGMRLETGPQ
jgi:hypothetical protein